MRKIKFISYIVLLSICCLCIGLVISNERRLVDDNSSHIDTRVDHIYYWVEAAKNGLVPFNPEVKAKAAAFTGSKINAISVKTEDSPDVAVTSINSTQSENSIFIDPNDASIVLNSNVSTENPVGSSYGANDFYSFDAAESWEGEVEGAGGNNSGDPAVAIGLNGRWYVNYITDLEGQGCSYSDDQGETWTAVSVAYTGGLLDKNHMWIDNNSDSPFEGNIYISWTNLGGEDDGEIGFAYSYDDGLSWTVIGDISSDVNAENHNQGVNLSTGPNGEVYAVWAIYDDWPGDETAIGFAKSLDGGVTWEPATRIISDIRGIRDSGTSKYMRVNSFPCAVVDNSIGDNEGNIYVCWSNIGIPGENTGDDIDIYLIKSTDEGNSWSDPIRVNQDESGLGKEHYFPWITCDPEYGVLSTIFYDDRNVDSTDIEVYCANSYDGGETWEDFKVSDVSSTPAPIPNMAALYFGDYIGIIATDKWVYPTWTDNRSGEAMTYVSPYQTNALNKPKELNAELIFETGEVNLIWTYENGEDFQHFKLYRNDEYIQTIDDTSYTDILPDYGFYRYVIKAVYSGDIESSGSSTRIQWGDAHISISPLSISEHLSINVESTQYIEVSNTGQLNLDYTIANFFNDSISDEYCYGEGGGNCYISRVEVENIDNVSGDSSYANYTNLIAPMQVSKGYPITVHNGNPLEYDRATCVIDWNGNKEFDEPIIVLSGSFTSGPYTGEIIPPYNAKSGLTRLRVRLSYGQGFDPCESEWRGEVEDYSIEVSNWLNIEPLNGTIAPGNTEMIAVNFNTENLEFGNYEAMVIFASNDPDADTLEINISLQVSQALVNIVTEQQGVCVGESVNLIATVMGSEALNYEWYSMPEGFSAETSEVNVSPEVSTWYFVNVTDTAYQSFIDSIFIEVYPLPTVMLGADTNICNDISWILDADNPGSTYLWSTGETTQTIEISYEGELGNKSYSVDVIAPTTCSNSDEIVINWVNCSDINEFSNMDLITIYPNPLKDNLNFQFPVPLNNESIIEIYDLHGNKLLNIQIPVQTETANLDVSNLESGVYFCRIINKNTIATKKIVVRK